MYKYGLDSAEKIKNKNLFKNTGYKFSEILIE